MPLAYVFLPRDLADDFSPLRREKPFHPARLRAPRVQRGQALPRAAGHRGPDVGQLPATGRRRAHDGHARLAAARIVRSVPAAGAGDVLELGAERSAAAEAGNPRDAGVVQLGEGLAVKRLHRRRLLGLAQLGRELGQQPRPYSGPLGCSAASLASSGGVDSTRQPPDLCRAPGGRDLAAERGMRRGVDGGIPQGDRPDQVAQLEPRQRRGEQDQDVTAAARRDVGDVPAAEALEQLAELGGLAPDRSGATFTIVPGSTHRQRHAGAGRVKVKSQQAAGTARRVIDRHRARLLRGLGGQRPGPPRRVSAAAVLRRPDVRAYPRSRA